jgi:nanoRNase/pAp phosphatase (c-di-AMP/oligoRNAs hydrolase)
VKRLKTKPTAKARAHAKLVRRKVFSIDEILKYIDPGPPKEAEKFVQLIYEERRQDRERVPVE